MSGKHTSERSEGQRASLSQAAQLTRAESDYQRFRNAYLDIARNDPSNEVGLAMIGADMDRAHAHLQTLSGLPRLPFTNGASTVLRREAERLSHQHEHEE